jgi:hypothetical protein
MLEPSKTGIPILRSRIERTRLVSTGRNEVLGELYDRSRYQLPSGRVVEVKTLSQMERVRGKETS